MRRPTRKVISAARARNNKAVLLLLAPRASAVAARVFPPRNIRRRAALPVATAHHTHLWLVTLALLHRRGCLQARRCVRRGPDAMARTCEGGVGVDSIIIHALIALLPSPRSVPLPALLAQLSLAAHLVALSFRCSGCRLVVRRCLTIICIIGCRSARWCATGHQPLPAASALPARARIHRPYPSHRCPHSMSSQNFSTCSTGTLLQPFTHGIHTCLPAAAPASSPFSP